MEETRDLVLKAANAEAPLAEQHDAFGKLVENFQDMAYACAYAVLGDFRLAEDAAQEAFLTAWRKLIQIRQPEAFPGWFKRIVLTECNRLRRGKHLPTLPLDDGVIVRSTDVDPQAAIERNEMKTTVSAAIKKLPENERIVVALFYIKEISQSDISAFLEVPTTTVAKRLYSARVRLKEMMEDSKNDFAARRPSRNKTFAEKVKAGIFDEYVGQYKYELRPELIVTIRREGDKLVSEVEGQTNNLFAKGKSENELRTKEFDGRGKFVRDAQGQVIGFIYYEFGREIGIAVKIS
ncbi:MAG: RNA polymerase sigma factor [Acidobacteriota bacterium]|nr:RNA polymerase sigma factor [Acidobacteriota bacterium]